jgi:hypothetical protein
VHPFPQRFLDLPKLRAHAIPARLPPELEGASPGFAADEDKPQELEGLRFAEPAQFAVPRRKAAELRRVFSGCSDSENVRSLSRIASQKRRASSSCWNPTTMSSAYRTMIMSPVACPQPFLDEPEDALIADPVFQEADNPFLGDLREERPDIGVQYEAHFLAADPDVECVQRIVLAAPRPEPIRKSEEVCLVHLVQHRRHRSLDDSCLRGR